MPEIIIRSCKKTDREDVLNICYRTGYMGEDLTGRGVFNDVKLFGYLFCLYYLLYEPEHGFVAVDKTNGKVVGYILGTDDSRRQARLFIEKMGWKIVLRVIFYTSWRHPESLRTVIFFLRNARRAVVSQNVLAQYPAHLHINILPEYQRMGIGKRLLAAFERHMAEKRVRGIHLRTSNKNIMAIPFYRRHGYKIISEKDIQVWKGVKDYKSLIFGKLIYGLRGKRGNVK